MKHTGPWRARRTTTKLNEHLNRRIPGTTNLPAAENATGAKLGLGGRGGGEEGGDLPTPLSLARLSGGTTSRAPRARCWAAAPQ